MANDINSLAHTRWNCKYHIVFAPKYRRKVFYGEKKRAIGAILRKLCEWKGVEIHEAEACPGVVLWLIADKKDIQRHKFQFHEETANEADYEQRI